jgi:ATP synthase protein I
MSDNDPEDIRRHQRELGDQVGEKELRKVRARKYKDRSIWFGLGMFGIVGWSVAIPTLIGLASGIWIDGNYPSRFSWTLMGLMIGLLVGCVNAWYWLNSEGRPDEDEEDEEQGNG